MFPDQFRTSHKKVTLIKVNNNKNDKTNLLQGWTEMVKYQYEFEYRARHYEIGIFESGFGMLNFNFNSIIL